MTNLIYSFHCLTLIVVPCLFGWVVLRRIMREHDLPTLVPGSLVVGLVSLMALINELRYWLELGPAAWFAYKLLFLGAVLLLALTRRPQNGVSLPRDFRAPWKIALVVAGALLTAVYFGIPANAGFLNDAWWGHLPIALEIQNAERFPLVHPFSLDDPLYYHFGPDILAATWSYLLDVPVARGFALDIIVLAPAIFLLGFAIGLRISRQFWAGLAGGALVIAGGNLRFLNIFDADLGNAASRLQVFNSQTIQGLIQMVFTPSHALGIPLTLLVLLILRPLLVRPTWPLAILLGLLLGALTLCAEWYFFPAFATVALCLLWRVRQRSAGQRRLMLVAVLSIAVAEGLYNNTYLASTLGHFWLRQPNQAQQAYVRVAKAVLERDRLPALPLPAPAGIPTAPSAFPASAAPIRSAVAAVLASPPWTPPLLAPLQLNLDHFGYVPSWESAGSNESSWVPLWSWAFLAEIFPVMIVGLPFGFWLCRRKSDPLVFGLVALACGSVLPPIFLNWGYRSTDFLRFFTGAFSFSALLLGLLIGRLFIQPSLVRRGLGGALAFCGLANAVGLGVLGLMPSTLATAKAVGGKGLSLSEAVSESRTARLQDPGAGSPSSTTAPVAALDQEAAFQRLAAELDQFLFPISRGRDRAIVIVPPESLPPLRVFPEWMKLASLSRLPLPVGGYWNDSPYAAYYREAVRTLDWQAIAGLDARWVIVTNLWGYAPPQAVTDALQDRRRFVPAHVFTAGEYYLRLYRSY